MTIHGSPTLLILATLFPQDSGGQVQELRDSAIKAREAGQLDRAVFLLRRAEVEARLASGAKSASAIRTLLRKLSSDETKRRHLITAAARALRKIGKVHAAKGLWAEAIPHLTLAERIEASAAGAKTLRACLFRHGPKEGNLPLRKLLGAEIEYANKIGDGWRIARDVLWTPKSAKHESFLLSSSLASIPGIQIDCEIKLTAPEAKAGLILGQIGYEYTYSLVEIRHSVQHKNLALSAHKYLIPPKNSYVELACYWQNLEEQEWKSLHIEIRSNELTLALCDQPAKVLLLPNTRLDGKLLFQHAALDGQNAANAYRNLRIRTLPTMPRAIRQVPAHLTEKELKLVIDKLLASADLATEMGRGELAKAYLDRASTLLVLATTKDVFEESIRNRRIKFDRLLSATRRAYSSAATKLNTLARAEAKEGRKILATYYRILSRSADPKGPARGFDEKEEEAIRALLPPISTLLEEAETLGDLKGWVHAKGVLVSSRPQGERTSLFLLPGTIASGTAINFGLRCTGPGIGFVFGYQSPSDRYTLDIAIKKGIVSVILDQELGEEPLNLLDFTAPLGKGDMQKTRLPVLLALHDHHIWIKIGRLAPRIIPLDKRRLRGRIGFRLIPNAGKKPVAIESLRLTPF